MSHNFKNKESVLVALMMEDAAQPLSLCISAAKWKRELFLLPATKGSWACVPHWFVILKPPRPSKVFLYFTSVTYCTFRGTWAPGMQTLPSQGPLDATGTSMQQQPPTGKLHYTDNLVEGSCVWSVKINAAGAYTILTCTPTETSSITGRTSHQKHSVRYPTARVC